MGLQKQGDFKLMIGTASDKIKLEKDFKLLTN